MSIERDVNVAVKNMFKFAHAVAMKNITSAIKKNAITIDENKVPGLSLLIQQSLDEAFIQSSKEVSHVIKLATKEGKIIEK